MAAAVVAAHNHVLRRWLRGETSDPVARDGRGDARRCSPSSPRPSGRADGSGTTVVAFRTGQDIDALLPSLRQLAGEGAST